MNELDNNTNSEWFAIRTKQDFKAEELLRPLCDDVFFPKETRKTAGKRLRKRAVIPHVLFIKTTRKKALELEKEGRKISDVPVSFWIYRYPNSDEIQSIHEKYIDLLRLITAEDTSKCEIFNKEVFVGKEHVRITDGIFKGYEGYVERVKKNYHVIVKVEGVCLVMLPYIHPDLLEKID